MLVRFEQKFSDFMELIECRRNVGELNLVGSDNCAVAALADCQHDGFPLGDLVPLDEFFDMLDGISQIRQRAAIRLKGSAYVLRKAL